MRHLSRVCAIFAFLVPNVAYSDHVDRETLQMIYGTAIMLCGDYSDNGVERKSTTEIETSLDDLASSLSERSGVQKEKITEKTYKGLIREQLGAEFSDVRDCRLRIWADLSQIVWSDHSASSSNPIELPSFESGEAEYSIGESQWFVIMGSFRDRTRASARLAEITKLGLLPSIVRTDDYPNLRDGYYSVVLPVQTLSNAREMERIVKTQVPDAYIKSPWR